jgi:hypothetical protein
MVGRVKFAFELVRVIFELASEDRICGINDVCDGMYVKKMKEELAILIFTLT